MSKCVNCLKEINEKEVFCLTCHEDVLECAKNQITNLEAKLAESEGAYRDINRAFTEQRELWKQQLAEKEKEIEKLNACVVFYKSYFVSFQEKVIDELERVKEFCNNPKNRVEYEYCPNAWTYAVDKDKLMLEIDNQIKAIKGDVQ